MNEQQLHDKAMEQAQLMLDQMISLFDDDPFLSNSEKLSLIYEIRAALDNAEHNLLTAPDRPFHVDGHEKRMNILKQEMAERRSAYLNH
ncbi:MAG: hypothetical protein IJV66_02495 [Firmicutes bacterium]|nr:hypothetical protein [Bacillota bacterium]